MQRFNLKKKGLLLKLLSDAFKNENSLIYYVKLK